MSEPKLMPIGKEKYETVGGICPKEHKKASDTPVMSDGLSLANMLVFVDRANVKCLEEECEQYGDIRPMITTFHTTHEEILTVLNRRNKK